MNEGARLRVAHVITSLQPGGAETMLERVVSYSKQRCDSLVICLGSDGKVAQRIREAGIEVAVLGLSWTLRAAQNTRAAVKILRAWQPQVIQGWMYHGNLAATLLQRATRNARLAWNIRCTLMDSRDFPPATRLVIRMGAALSGLPDLVMFNSGVAVGQHLRAHFKPQRVRVIPNGFDVSRFVPDAAARATGREALGIGRSEVLVGYVGRYHLMKNLSGLLRAAARLAARGVPFKLLLAGTGIDARNSALGTLVTSLNLSDRVTMLGQVDDVSRLMPVLDILCLPSTWGEAFPNVIGEAMACGVPCVATDVGDVRAILGDTGRVVPPGDLDRLAESLEVLISMSEAERSTLGVQARQRICDRYDIRSIVDEYLGIYDGLAAAKSR